MPRSAIGGDQIRDGSVRPADLEECVGGAWREFPVPAYFMRSGPTATRFIAFRDGIYAHAFAGGGTNLDELFFSFSLPFDLKVGTALHFRVHWAHNTPTATGSVKWSIDYLRARADAGMGLDVKGSASVVQPVGAAFELMSTPDDAITASPSPNIEPGTLFLARLYRDAGDPADTFTGDAFLLHTSVKHQVGSLGTEERNRPFTSRGFE